jgi:hypothetical protein
MVPRSLVHGPVFRPAVLASDLEPLKFFNAHYDNDRPTVLLDSHGLSAGGIQKSPKSVLGVFRGHGFHGHLLQ